MPRPQLRRAAWAPALLLAVLLQAAGGAPAAAAARRANCGSGRRLRQGPSTPSPDGNNTIETVEVDVVSQECSMSQNVYFLAAAPSVRIITEPDVNLQPTARSCCASCHDIPACSAFQWCPLQEGCSVPGASSANITFPYQGCQLLDLNAFLRTSVNTGEIKAEGPDVPFTIGTPLFFSVPKLTGYDVEVGRNMGGKFNYTCTATIFQGSCVMIGSAQASRIGRGWLLRSAPGMTTLPACSALCLKLASSPAMLTLQPTRSTPRRSWALPATTTRSAWPFRTGQAVRPGRATSRTAC
jgi:hypothetical protein